MEQVQTQYDLKIINVVESEGELSAQPKEVIKFNRDKLKTAFWITGIQIHVADKLSENIFQEIFQQHLNALSDRSPLVNQNEQELQESAVSMPRFKDILYEQLVKKDYIKEKQKSFLSYMESFLIAFKILDKKIPIIIMLGGTSGTGKSTVASILATRFGIPTCLSTDSVRHIMRNFLSLEQNPVLFASTYQAYKQIAFDPSQNMSEQSKIIKGYKSQCTLVQQNLEQIIE